MAVDGVQVIGFVNGRTGIGDGLLPGVLGEMDSFYVVPEGRDKGISRALAEAAACSSRWSICVSRRCGSTDRDMRSASGHPGRIGSGVIERASSSAASTALVAGLRTAAGTVRVAMSMSQL